MAVAEITPQEWKDVIAQERYLLLIDVRPLIEFRRVHLVGAENVPFDELSPDRVASGQNNEAASKAYVICKAGVRSRQACEKLAQAGFANVVSVKA